MKATNWEFLHRGAVFGMIFGVAFFLYAADHVIAAQGAASWIARRTGQDERLVLRSVIGIAAAFMAACAALRTWASAYLRPDVVYAPEVQTAVLVADGPYRHLRNPLYFANALMAVGIGATAGRIGFLFLVPAMVAFCYRLILREEAELLAEQGQAYADYLRAVPRFWPSIRARAEAAGVASWATGFRAEAWSWALVGGLLAVAITLNLGMMLVAGGIGIALAWIWSGAKRPTG